MTLWLAAHPGPPIKVGSARVPMEAPGGLGDAELASWAELHGHPQAAESARTSTRDWQL